MDNPRLNQLLKSTDKLNEDDKEALMAKFQALKAKPVEHASKVIRNIRLVHHCGCGSNYSADYHIVIPEDASPEDLVFADYFIDHASASGYFDSDDLATLVELGGSIYYGKYDGNASNWNPSDHELAFGPDM